MSWIDPLYTAGVAVAAAALPLLARGEGKLARGVRGRAGALERLEAWSAGSRDPRRPLVWFHAPSVGEGLQARAVIEAIRALRPELQLAYTFFSPSAERLAGALPVDVAAYLPPDRPSIVRRLLGALAPAAIAFTKTEIWPNVVREAERRGIPAALLSATLPLGSSRLTAPARILLAPAHRRLARVGAISKDDAERFGAFGVPRERRLVMGDARFDQVARRAAAVDRRGPLLRLISRRGPVLVAGSTWPGDEEHLVDALARLRAAGPWITPVFVPHEPTEEHLTRLESRLRDRGLPFQRLTQLERRADDSRGEEPSALVVDRVGVLGELYGAADIALVGGGFGKAGLHSVLEPAAFGLPVLFGPRHENAREAADLIRLGAGIQVGGAIQMADALAELITNPTARKAAGSAALRYIEQNLGAAERGAHMLLELIDGRS